MIDWVESRTGLVSALKDFLTEDVPGGASYWYVFGSATLIVLTVQIVTGIILCFYYSPSSWTAWESTQFIYRNVWGGSFLISLHYWGASAMIILMSMHLLQVLVFGSYKKPRELQWVVGVLLFFIVLSMGLTGYLLPWDLNAYFATQVAINIAASVPIIGPFIYHFLSDGSTLGTLTLGRFFGLHVWATPAAIIGLVGLHLFIFRHNSSAGPPADEAPVTFGRFYPNQIFMDTVASVLAFAIIVVLAFVMPAPLLAKADPNNAQFIPAPAWYFYALYGLLRMFPQNLSLVPTVILPGLFTMVLLLLPWLDRNPHRSLARRPFTVPFVILSVALLIGITVYSAKIIGDEIAKSPVGQTPVEGYGAPPSQESVPTIALTYPQTAAAGPVGATVFAQNCASCHGAAGKGTPGSFPPLDGNPFVTGDPNKVIGAVMHGMKGPIVVNGVSFSGAIPMPSWSSKLSPAEVAAVVTYIRSAWGNHASAVTEAQVKAISK
ncbi:MAG: cytochrome b N-terminal domain-containing protein [Candidatus Eremiobacteraeota bacterium]|nr:cytochrome b N-terminal domain-containing protein [Candidatus Eremiobacteraeota bacterium]MBV8339452.1 cytochrome b N-terminal domain-containing protein [Candidatus Eremiobacteraeota bacterium]MBV8461127.1 cytochrome b N-terminal domain-containing protein [Candidatus Eremiobacteraeota bacterium]MBV8597132.1 cytochrome b N-terminal domain-containing protein [Candidatus Eremiobacteraeota bacterium]